ncbi:MAG: translation factor GTPase family protein [Agathobacter sp.]|nr:translation factor GTPase family protein [Agathobacter sp.]
MVIGILAHVDAGKTTLSEAMLYKTGQIRNLGRVDHQDAYLDTDDQERERGITIFSKQARIVTDDWKVTLLDTPGHADFSAEMERTLQVLDYAILVVSGTDGVQGHTRTLWRLLKHYNIPIFIFVNKMDMDGTDQSRLMQELKAELEDGCVAFGVSDLEQFYDELAMCSEAMLNAYMEDGQIGDELIRNAIVERQVFPCYFGSALKLEGVEEFLSGLKRYTQEKAYPREFSARIYKIGRDDRGVRLTYMKLTGGQLVVREKLEYGKDGLVEKVDQIRKYSGEKFETVDKAFAGEIIAVTGLTGTHPGEGLGAEAEVNVPMLEPVLNYQLILPKEVNPSEFMKNMRILEEEAPQLYVVWKEELREIHVQLMGEVQMEVLVRQIKDRFDVVVTFGPGSIVYKETIAKPVEGVGHFEPLRHYAEVHLLLAPGETGSGVTVDSVCSEDILDKNWQRLIATHVEEREHKGVLTGSSLTDVKITILTGKAHTKHTEGGDFRQATYRAIRQGLKSTESILLEPYYNFVLEVPIEHVGRAMTDLEQAFSKMDPPEFNVVGDREMATIKGSGPVACLQTYVSEVHAYTKGLGHLMLELSGYDVCHNPQEVIVARGYDSEQDFRNPTGSVFCAHGAGFVVPWDEVKDYMHLPYVFHGDMSEEALAKAGAAGSDGNFYDNGLAFSGTVSGEGRGSWEKSVAKMSSVELDAELADVYAREFGMSKTDLENQERRKWAKAKSSIPEGLSGKPRTVKHDKKGNTIYPAKGPQEEYLIVDGYNIIFAWEELNDIAKTNIDAARDRLKDELQNYQGFKQCKVIVVFDAYKVKDNAGRKEDYNGIEVYYTKTDETADAFIERRVHNIRDKYKVTVATNDSLEQQTVMSLGALRMSARELKETIEQYNKRALEEYRNGC